MLHPLGISHPITQGDLMPRIEDHIAKPSKTALLLIDAG